MQLAVQHKALDVEQAQFFHLRGWHEVVVPGAKPPHRQGKQRRQRQGGSASEGSGLGLHSLCRRAGREKKVLYAIVLAAWSDAAYTFQMELLLLVAAYLIRKLRTPPDSRLPAFSATCTCGGGNAAASGEASGRTVRTRPLSYSSRLGKTWRPNGMRTHAHATPRKREKDNNRVQ